MTALSFSFLSLFIFAFSSDALGQQQDDTPLDRLLELPTLENKSAYTPPPSPSSDLQLLSPDELQLLYNEEEVPVAPTPAPPDDQPPVVDNAAQEMRPAAPDIAVPLPPSATSEPDVMTQNLMQPDEVEEMTEENSALEENENDDSNQNSPPEDDVLLVKESSNDIDAIWPFGSIMLTPKELGVFDVALKGYEASLHGDELEIFSIEPEPEEEEIVEIIEEPEDYPFIIVDSILYMNDKNWSAWINRTRFTHMDPSALAGIRVTSVTPQAVTFTFSPKTREDSENQPPQETGTFSPDFKMQENKNPNITQQADGNYRVTLTPNQMYVANTGKIYEGRGMSNELYNAYNDFLERKRLAEEQKLMASEQPPVERMMPPEPVSQADRDRRNAQKLMDLYRNSGDELFNFIQ